jgi:hypothetical protein
LRFRTLFLEATASLPNGCRDSLNPRFGDWRDRGAFGNRNTPVPRNQRRLRARCTSEGFSLSSGARDFCCREQIKTLVVTRRGRVVRGERLLPGATVSSVDRVLQVFHSFEDADRADHQFYADLTPEERLDVLLELVERHRSALGETANRLERVHRVVELSQR